MDEYSNLNSEKFLRDPSTLEIAQLFPHRPTMGSDISVVLWRLIRVVGMHQILKEETPIILYFIGKEIGKKLKSRSPEELIKTLTNLKIGRLDLIMSKELIRVSIAECLTCDGITPPLGKPICQFETGIVAGALEMIYPDKKIIGEETKCIGGLGDEICLVECQII